MNETYHRYQVYPSSSVAENIHRIFVNLNRAVDLSILALKIGKWQAASRDVEGLAFWCVGKLEGMSSRE